MTETAVDILIRRIGERALAGGGFCARPGGDFRPDATAWAVLALSAAGRRDEPAVAAARRCLAQRQTADGRVPGLAALPEAYWPTSLALLAWQGEGDLAPAADRAADFLLKTRSIAIPYTEAPGADHDSSLIGWPWVVDTYAWLVPTAYAVMALTAHGRVAEGRVIEGRRLILDRQIPSGGWNYGDTLEFGTELLPFPDTTGIALCALRGGCAAGDVEKSLRYLAGCLSAIRAPWSLSWGILGLSAWDRRPAAAGTWIAQSLARQDVSGEVDTEALALLCLASHGDLF